MGGAIVTVLRADDARHVEAIIGPSGARVLPINAIGTYRVRVRRVGYRPFVSPPIRVMSTADVALELRLPETRIPLPTVLAAVRGRCDVGGAYDTHAADVLETAKTSLIAASVAWRDQFDPLDVWLVSRRYSLSGRVLDSVRVARPARTEEPFESDSAEVLHRDGYVHTDTLTGDRVYFLPSVETMISDAFLDTHCFAVVDDRRDSSRVGLRFEPLHHQQQPDVRGTMWLERTHRALSLIEFAFQQVTYPAATRGATGRVRIRTLPSGVRFVDEWHIRMPLFGVVWSGATAGNRVRQVGWKEDGGAARVRLTGRGADTIPLAGVRRGPVAISTWGYH